MSFCKNCGTEMEEQAKFCGSCGATVEEPAITPPVGEDNKKSFSINMSKNSIIALVVAVLVVLGSIIPIRNYMIRKDPIKRTFYGINKLYKANAMYTTSTLKLQMTAVPEDAQSKAIAKIIESFSIRLDSKSSNKNGEVSLNAALVYKDQPFIKANLYLNKEGMAISAPDLYNKTMFGKWDEMSNLTSQEKKNSQVDIEKYKKLLDFSTSKSYEAVSKDYSQLFSNSFKGSFVTGDKTKLEVVDGGTSKFISTGTVNFTTDSGAVIEFLDKFIEKAAKDSKVKALIKDKLLEFFDIIEKNNDYDKFDITKEEVETARKDFDKEYDNAMAQLLKEKDFTEVKNALNMNVKSSLRFDSSNNYRGALTEINASVNEGEAVGFKIVMDQVINSLDSKLTVDKIDFTGVDITKMSLEEQEDMSSQLQQNIMNIIDKLGITSLLIGQ